MKLRTHATSARHQQHWVGAFEDGIRHGEDELVVHDADLGVVWGMHGSWRHQYKNYVVMERGYFNDRLSWTSVGLNGLNNRADFNNKDMPSDRWDVYGPELQPWKQDGKYWLVIGQVAGDASLASVNGNLSAWYKTIVDELTKTGIPVVFRPHPLSRQINPQPTLQTQLLDAKGVVTFNSNVGVDATITGVPVMCCDNGSMVWDIAAHTIDELINFHYPDRCQWAYNLAYTQWTKDEIACGLAWQHIRPKALEYHNAIQ